MVSHSGKRLGLFILAASFASAAEPVGDIEFFGYQGIDLAKVRERLPIHSGDPYSDQTKRLIAGAIAKSTGKQPTDIAAICCDQKGNRLLFIGLPGLSYKRFTYNSEPNGKDRLPPDFMSLYDRLDHALEAAVRRGGDAAQEDDSNGYALVKDPAARALELQLRDWAIQHEPELLHALDSSDVPTRQNASDALGYVRQSREQILALVRAARDPDDDVRNNATRALGVLVRSKSSLAATIPPDTFIAMLNSGTWTDRNKAASLLDALTTSRDPALLAKLRAAALPSLIEMASWRDPSHASFARMILGRIGGLPEDKLSRLAWDGPISTILAAVNNR